MRDRLVRFAAFGLALTSYWALSGCGASPSDPGQPEAAHRDIPSALPDAWNDGLRLTTLTDQDPAPDVVEVSLEAGIHRVEIAPGKSVEAWTYAGVSPGPLIRAKVGDTLKVHFRNQLPEATTIHWHGLEVPADQDGAGQAGSEIPAGASFDYEFPLLHAGTYWYHPHLNSAAQVWRGLYGALIVEDPNEPALGQELTLLLHDVELDPNTGELAPADAQGELGRFFGHEGSTLLVNGRVLPTLRAYPGSSLRLRIINASNSRYYRLAVEGHRLTRVAGDSGFSEQSQQVDDVLLTPGERTELVLTIAAPAGSTLRLRSTPYARFVCGPGCGDSEDLMSIQVVAGQGQSVSVPAQLASIEPIDLRDASSRELVLSEVTRAGVTALAINDHVHGQDDLMLRASVGSTELWTVKNATDYDHPFHLHGFRFQLLEVDGRAPPLREWKDTANVPAKTQLRFAVHFDARPGMWMFHCHILDHADLGMMGMLQVE